jgi:hypothetical protein
MGLRRYAAPNLLKSFQVLTRQLRLSEQQGGIHCDRFLLKNDFPSLTVTKALAAAFSFRQRHCHHRVSHLHHGRG